MSVAKFDTWQNSDGTENYKCRAWVNFDGTGTVSIRASGNVSSITDNGTGNYTINFTNAMPDANYSISGLCHYDGVSDGFIGIRQLTVSISSFRAACANSAGALGDKDYIAMAIFR